MIIYTITDFEGRICVLCGESDPRVLLEKHHIFGRANSAETLYICKNCHSKVTQSQNMFPPKARSGKASITAKRDFEDVSTGALLELIGKKLKKRGLEHGCGRKGI